MIWWQYVVVKLALFTYNARMVLYVDKFKFSGSTPSLASVVFTSRGNWSSELRCKWNPKLPAGVHVQHIPVHPRFRLHTAFSLLRVISLGLWGGIFGKGSCLFCLHSLGQVASSSTAWALTPPPRHCPGGACQGGQKSVFGGSIIPFGVSPVNGRQKEIS